MYELRAPRYQKPVNHNIESRTFWFQMDFLHLLVISGLIPFALSQRPDNDGNDIDNDQDLDINAFGNVITPIKGNKLIKKNNHNKIFHIYLNHDDEDDMLIVNDSMPETVSNLIGLAGLGGVIIGQTC